MDSNEKNESDADLVRRARAGETHAFGQIVSRYYAALTGVARAYCSNADDAADAVQNALLLSCLHIGQLQDPRRLGPWLRRVTVNACRQNQRRSPWMARLDAVPEKGLDGASATDTRLLLQQILACLSPEARLTVLLYYQRELSLQEIAAFQEVPVTTIKSRLRNARARLRKEWETIMEETLPTKTASPASPKEPFLPRLLRQLDSTGNIYYMAFSPDGTRMVTAAGIELTDTETETEWVSSIACWESGTGNPVWAFTHTTWAYCPSFLPDGRHVALASGRPDQHAGTAMLKNRHSDNDCMLLILDAATGAADRTILGTPGGTIAITKDGRFVAIGGSEAFWNKHNTGEQGIAVIYDLTTGERVLKVAPHLNSVTALALSPDGTILAADSLLKDADPESKDLWIRSDIRLWGAATGALLHTLEKPNAKGLRHNIAFSPDGTLLAAPNGREGVLLWDPTTGALVRTLKGSDSPVFFLAFSPDGALLACGSGDKTVRLWDVQTGECQRSLTDFAHAIYALAFSPDGKMLATADAKGLVQFWAL